MKNLIFTLLITISGLLVSEQCLAGKKIPVTSASEKAKTLYNEAMIASEDVYFSKFLKLTNEAIKADPDFFMAYYQLAIANLYLNEEDKFKEYGEHAVNCKAKLSEGELLLKDAMAELLKNPKSDNTEIGKKLVKLYPDDVNAYMQLYFFQVIADDPEGQEATLKSALKNTDKPAPLYNLLGYTYMKLEKNEEAAKAFDKYIELRPTLPNPYDSKGDYYMKIKDYGKAYSSFMKAHEIDSLWSYKKALYAKTMADSLEKK